MRIRHWRSWRILAFRVLFEALQLFPPIAGHVAYKHFFQPRRGRSHKVSGLRTYDLALTTEAIQVYDQGQGPTVLVVHGWESSVARLQSLINALIASDFRVVAFDMPAHGQSSAKDTDILQITDIILDLNKTAGSFAAAIGHSFGGLCLANAIRCGLDIPQLILISAPSTLTGVIDKYCGALGIRGSTKSRLLRAIEKRLLSHEIVHDIDLQLILQCSEVSTLVIHDRDDVVIPFSEGMALSRSRSDIELFATDKLGHSGLVKDPQTIAKCISFISRRLQSGNEVSEAGTMR